MNAAGAGPKPPRRLAVFKANFSGTVTLTPTPITAALAGAFAGIVMPMLWPRLTTDSMILVLVFLVVVALPAHAFVVGFGRNHTADAKRVDTALLKRVAAWLLTAVAAAALGRALGG